MFTVILPVMVIAICMLLCLMSGIVFFCTCKMTDSFLNDLLGIFSHWRLQYAILEAGSRQAAHEGHLFHISKHSVMDMDILFRFYDRILELFHVRKGSSLLFI